MSRLLNAGDAEIIATKLGAELVNGRKHVNAKVRCDGVFIGQFGIRRGTNLGHDYIPRQIQISMRDALGLARCTLYQNDYKKALQDRGVLPPDPPDNADEQ